MNLDDMIDESLPALYSLPARNHTSIKNRGRKVEKIKGATSKARRANKKRMARFARRKKR